MYRYIIPAQFTSGISIMNSPRGVVSIVVLAIILAIGVVVADESITPPPLEPKPFVRRAIFPTPSPFDQPGAEDFDDPAPPKPGHFVSKAILGEYTEGAVSANGLECAEIGRQMLAKGGHAVDAAISTLLCDGAVAFQSMGIGGGFLMTIYDKNKKGPAFLNARETAPARAFEKMYGTNAEASLYGGPSIAVPGEILGFWEAHQAYGKLEWHELFEPVADLCENGFLVTQYLRDELMKVLHLILLEPTLKFLINPETNLPWPVNYKMRRPEFAATLRTLGKGGADVFYNGTMGRQLVKEIQEMGGVVEMSDLQNYRVEWALPITNKIGDLTMYTSRPPGSGAILSMIVNIITGYKPPLDLQDKKVFWHRVIETFKYAYARRSKLGDAKFNDIESLLKKLTSPEYATLIRDQIKDDFTTNDTSHYGMKTAAVDDHGTGNVCVLSPDGSAVAVTSTINQILGAMRRSKSTGIIFNDEMDDFSSPGVVNGFGLQPSKANFIKPGKRPMSSMVPTIIVDKDGTVQLVIGAAGGTKITSSVSLAIIRHLLTNETIKETLDAPRVHHQLLPAFLEHEDDFDPEVLEHLRSLGHGVTPYVRMGSTLTAIARVPGGINANADYRREGSVAGLEVVSHKKSNEKIPEVILSNEIN